jgi:hypothetical protein
MDTLHWQKWKIEILFWENRIFHPHKIGKRISDLHLVSKVMKVLLCA